MLVSIRNVNANGFIYYGEFTEFGSSKEGSLANGKRKHKFRPSIALRNCLEDIEEIRNRGESRLNQKWRESMSELTKDENLRFCMLARVKKQNLNNFILLNGLRRCRMEERLLTEPQRILAQYLGAQGIPTLRGLEIGILLWEEEATMEMLKYIIDTEEEDPAKLYEIALKISKKYETEENPD